MMYSNKLAVAVKASGKVLREFKDADNTDTVYVPFGAEYTILIKNLNTVRVQVRVELDGTDATEGTWLVIDANSELELKRFIKNGNLQSGNSFKFIERNAAIENGPRGVKAEDGLIRIEYQFEKPYVYEPLVVKSFFPRDRWIKREYWERDRDYYPIFGDLLNTTATFSASPTKSADASTGSVMRGMSMSASAASASIGSVNAFHSNAMLSDTMAVAQNAAAPTVINEAGITVPGSQSDQTFTTVAAFAVEATKHVMVIKLLGETESGKPVVKPVTVKSRPKCVTCGHVNKAKAKFCSECGTSLEIV